MANYMDYLCRTVACLLFLGFAATVITLSVVLPLKDAHAWSHSDFHLSHGSGRGSSSFTACQLPTMPGLRSAAQLILASNSSALGSDCATFHHPENSSSLCQDPVVHDDG
ncbi:hypothetical protein PG994_014259 [Apiospora phragmitis]|uniref:Uncharacterized protein n=1 Tax=Apiospora phragmitis TaxID=2905665 RepID=A0ABR1T3S9_9PEZI